MLISSSIDTTSVTYGYPKENRLLKPDQFRAVFDKALFKCHQPNLMAFVAYNSHKHARLGLAITKKKVPTAVARNRLKRLIRERFRHDCGNLANVDIVFIAKRPTTALTNDQLVNEIVTILQKICKKTGTN